MLWIKVKSQLFRTRKSKQVNMGKSFFWKKQMLLMHFTHVKKKRKRKEKLEFFQVSFHTTDYNITNDPVNDVQ